MSQKDPMREAFEAWYLSLPYPYSTNCVKKHHALPDRYSSSDAQKMWLVWQACAAAMAGGEKQVNAQAQATPLDKGPWFVDTSWGKSRVVIQSEDFTHDVALEVSGDFASSDDRRKCAEELAARLNATNATAPAPTGGEEINRQLLECTCKAADMPFGRCCKAMLPNFAGKFSTFSEWVKYGQLWLKSPSHEPAICVDAKGRRCSIGAHFKRAQDEGTFPIRYFWNCEDAAIAAAKEKA